MQLLSLRKIPNNDAQEAPQTPPQLTSLTTPSPSRTAQATSPAATQTTLLRWRLAARDPAVPEHARLSMPRFVHPGIVQTTLKPVRSSSEVKMNKVEDQLQLCQGVKTPMMNEVDSQMPLRQAVICVGASVMGAK